MADLSFYKGKKVFITGHTGFKGSWLSKILVMAGAEVTGYALNPPTNPNLFDIAGLEGKMTSVIGDIRDFDKLSEAFAKAEPEIVFHLAAQPIVLTSYEQPRYTYETNVMGTVNILECARQSKTVKSVLNVTTDKVYKNNEWCWGYRENEPLDGYDPYSNSKSCSELVTHSYKASFFDNTDIAVSTARAGNVIGGGDWARDRLIPDCIKAINNSIPIEIRNPAAVRPWQHVLEPLSGYLLLGQKLLEYGKLYAQAYNFGPIELSVLTVAEVAQKVVDNYGKGKVIVGEKKTFHEAGLLMLDITKAKEELGWTPALSADKAIKNTVDWYKKYYHKENMYDYTMQQIKEYEEFCGEKYA